MKALALASGRPLAAVSALEALAQKLRLPGVEVIVPMIDARKGEFLQVSTGPRTTAWRKWSRLVPIARRIFDPTAFRSHNRFYRNRGGALSLYG